MKYKVVKNGANWCVVNSWSGRTVFTADFYACLNRATKLNAKYS